MNKSEKTRDDRRNFILQQMTITHSEENRAAEIARLEARIAEIKACKREGYYNAIERLSKALFLSESTLGREYGKIN